MPDSPAPSDPPSPTNESKAPSDRAPKDVDKPWVDGPERYLAYVARAKLIMLRASAAIRDVRHLAYASDAGESLRPILPKV